MSPHLHIAGSSEVQAVVAGTVIQHFNGQKADVPRQLTPYLMIDVEQDCIGREQDLKRLADAMAQSSKVVVVNGVGGIGKTTLAKAWFQGVVAQYDHFAWLTPAGSEDRASFSLVETVAYHPTLALNLNLSFGEKESPEQRFSSIMNALRQLKGRNLLVIDNAGIELEQKNIRAELPLPPHWQVLLTARSRLEGYSPLALDRLSPPHAAALFRQHYTHACPNEAIEALLQEVDYHTLTVELIAKTLENHLGALRLEGMTDKLRRRELHDPALQRRISAQHSEEETEVYLHLLATFDVAGLDEAERLLLARLAALPPGSTLSAEQCEEWLQTSESERRALQETLRLLERKGWLNYQDSLFSLHRMIQQAVLYQLQPGLETLEVLVKTFTQKLGSDVSTNFTLLFPWIPYAEQLLVLLSEREREQASVVTLLNNLGCVIEETGQYDRARDLLEAALAAAVKNFGPEHPNVAVRQSNLAIVYTNLGQYDRARDLLEAALAADLKNFGPEHPNVATHYNNLAHVYAGMNDTKKALELFEKALTILKANFGENHPYIDATLKSIATLKNPPPAA